MKTHEGSIVGPKYNARRYKKAIVIIRNPHHSLLAEFKREYYKKIEKYRNDAKQIYKGNYAC